MKTARRGGVCEALEGWMSGWPFTAFITLTYPYGRWGYRTIPASFQSRLDKLMSDFEKKWGVAAGAVGVATLSYAGHLHAHMAAVKENREPFSETELAWIQKRWAHIADARPVTGLPHLLEYIASEKHLVNCRSWEPAFCGDSALNRVNPGNKPKRSSSKS